MNKCKLIASKNYRKFTCMKQKIYLINFQILLIPEIDILLYSK